jgi:TolB-like protein
MMERSARQWAFRFLAITALGADRSASAQSGPVVIAILPFEDRGSYGQDKEVFRALRLGIPATIASELSGHSELRLADRNRVEQALRKQNPDPSGRLDAATAARVGKEAGARYAISGNFADFYGKFRLDARIIDTESGEILKVVSNNDPKLQDRADLYRIIQMVGHQVLAQASRSTARDGTPEAEGMSIPTQALTQYSLGLLYESQGDRNKAGEHYQQALTAFPNYPDAREAVRRVRGF